MHQGHLQWGHLGKSPLDVSLRVFLREMSVRIPKFKADGGEAQALSIARAL